jgi:hypothetical protein
MHGRLINQLSLLFELYEQIYERIFFLVFW